MTAALESDLGLSGSGRRAITRARQQLSCEEHVASGAFMQVRDGGGWKRVPGDFGGEIAELGLAERWNQDVAPCPPHGVDRRRRDRSVVAKRRQQADA